MTYRIKGLLNEVSNFLDREQSPADGRHNRRREELGVRHKYHGKGEPVDSKKPRRVSAATKKKYTTRTHDKESNAKQK